MKSKREMELLATIWRGLPEAGKDHNLDAMESGCRALGELQAQYDALLKSLQPHAADVIHVMRRLWNADEILNAAGHTKLGEEIVEGM